MILTYRKIGMLLMMAAICTTTLVLLWRWHDSLSWMSSVLGLCVGFTTGLLSAPFKDEEGIFREYAKIASGFLTGFLVSKVDQVFNLVMDEKRGPLILNELFVRRLMVGVCGFFIAMIGVFLARRYFNEPLAPSQSPGTATDEVPPSAASSSSA
jgi:hypothetical protein